MLSSAHPNDFGRSSRHLKNRLLFKARKYGGAGVRNYITPQLDNIKIQDSSYLMTSGKPLFTASLIAKAVTEL